MSDKTPESLTELEGDALAFMLEIVASVVEKLPDWGVNGAQMVEPTEDPGTEMVYTMTTAAMARAIREAARRVDPEVFAA